MTDLQLYDRVAYADPHIDYLREVGMWPIQHRYGEPDFFGTVIGRQDGTVTVEWDMGRPFPKRGKVPRPHPSVHLAENLRVSP